MMTSFLNWLSMGGYAFYIWSAYGLVFGVLSINLFSISRQRLRVYRLLQRWFQYENRT